jgi:phage terminase large subunit GpA-like protein
MNDAEFYFSQNNLLPTERPPASICQWAEARRILPANTPWPGPYKYSRTPYQREICENLAPYSPIINTIVLKSRKCGLTTAMENCIAYWAFAWPTDVIYSTATEALAKQFSTETFMHVIESMGYRDRLISQFSDAKNKRNPATVKKIEYSGGHIDIISSGSLDARRQKNARCIFLDEVDGVPELTTTGEGSYIDILKGHQMAWGPRRKFCAFSSPTTFETSAIWKLYSEYDERKYLINCPNCGRLMEFKDTDNQANFGLKANTKAGKIIEVYYQCEFCGDPIFNKDKSILFSDNPYCKRDPHKKLEPAHWEPTKKTDDPYSRSYSINALYSPIGALTFTDIYKAKQKAEHNGADVMRSYVNIYMGQPFKDAGTRPKIEKVIELRGDYKSGTVPKGVLFLTIAVDVQKGSEKDPDNPPRLELEILGHGWGYRTWSILYKRIEGATDDYSSGAWKKFTDWATETELAFMRADGVKLWVQIIGIDSGDQQETVYRFCESYPGNNIFPVKGFGARNMKTQKDEKGDLPGGFRRYRSAVLDNSDKRVLEINTWHYKNLIYAALKVERKNTEPQNSNFCAFPRDYPDEYFAMLTGEEKRMDGSYHPIRSRVEALDCRVYNLALADFFLETQVNAFKADFKKLGYSPLELQDIDVKWVLKYIENRPNYSNFY